MHASCKSLIISCVSKAYYWESKKASERIPMPMFVCMFSVFLRDENMLLDEVNAAL